ncbi:MAG: cell division protein ZapA [Acidobacteria bacterium]|nr:cell division protein ZapA [Acidobacteriota bacterium]
MPISSDGQNRNEVVSQTVDVRIYNQTYSIRGGNSVYIKKLASYVDQRMREVAQATHTVDTLRVAILAALNISDELFKTQEKVDELDSKIAERSSEYANLLDSVLKKTGPPTP